MKQIFAKANLFVFIALFLLAACETSRRPLSTPDRVETAPEADPAVVENPEPPVVAPLPVPVEAPAPLRLGAGRLDQYLSMLRGKTVALVVNHTSLLESGSHLVDSLVGMGIRIKTIFAPEHGFRGTADAGDKIEDGRDARTGIQLVSLYGKKQEPSAEDLAGVDWVIFDIQDVGVRFYTYISTMHYAMQACAKHGVKFMVLDRPNPNGHLIDGPMRQPGYESFVGMHPVPVAHGMTVGEYARMVNGEGWLAGGLKVDLTVVPCENYTHSRPYDLPAPPSPNLPDMRAVYLYPSTCFFEGTVFSEGRGTTAPFQLIGHPDSQVGDTVFVPVSRPGAQNPKLKGQACRGFNLSRVPLDSVRALGRLDLSYLIELYRGFPNKESFFLKNLYFDKLAGGPSLRVAIVSGKSEAEIRASWAPELEAFRKLRARYLLYP